MDNFRCDVTCEGREPFDTIFTLMMKRAPGKATHYAIRDGKGLILCWSAPGAALPEARPLPYAMDAAAAREFVWHWLDTADYGEEPDHDGDNGKGWRLYNEAWGHVADCPYAFLAVQPAWAMYGK